MKSMAPAAVPQRTSSCSLEFPGAEIDARGRKQYDNQMAFEDGEGKHAAFSVPLTTAASQFTICHFAADVTYTVGAAEGAEGFVSKNKDSLLPKLPPATARGDELYWRELRQRMELRAVMNVGGEPLEAMGAFYSRLLREQEEQRLPMQRRAEAELSALKAAQHKEVIDLNFEQDTKRQIMARQLDTAPDRPNAPPMTPLEQHERSPEARPQHESVPGTMVPAEVMSAAVTPVAKRGASATRCPPRLWPCSAMPLEQSARGSRQMVASAERLWSPCPL